MSNFGSQKKFKLIIQLFYEGLTELDYLQKFIQQQKKTNLVRLNKTYNDLKMPKSEVWLIFDHDGREREVREAIDIIKQSRKDIHIAFMKPCIEIWPLLHNNINNVTTQTMAQSKLEEIMPSYKHDRNPYFELSKMPNYVQAVQKAHQWEISLSGASEYNSAKFAGIYKLTEKIKNI